MDDVVGESENECHKGAHSYASDESTNKFPELLMMDMSLSFVPNIVRYGFAHRYHYQDIHHTQQSKEAHARS